MRGEFPEWMGPITDHYNYQYGWLDGIGATQGFANYVTVNVPLESTVKKVDLLLSYGYGMVHLRAMTGDRARDSVCPVATLDVRHNSAGYDLPTSAHFSRLLFWIERYALRLFLRSKAKHRVRLPGLALVTHNVGAESRRFLASRGYLSAREGKEVLLRGDVSPELLFREPLVKAWEFGVVPPKAMRATPPEEMLRRRSTLLTTRDRRGEEQVHLVHSFDQGFVVTGDITDPKGPMEWSPLPMVQEGRLEQVLFTEPMCTCIAEHWGAFPSFNDFIRFLAVTKKLRVVQQHHQGWEWVKYPNHLK